MLANNPNLNTIKSSKTADQVRQAYGTGRRKTATARVWITDGPGVITINKKVIDQYFTRNTHIKSIMKPFVVTDTEGQYNINCTVTGSGNSGQAGAIVHGIARALDKLVPELHQILRSNGLLTRDPRAVERKKYGQHKARKKTQFSKR